jgi:hypothetical protein
MIKKKSINNLSYIKRFEDNLKDYNEDNKTNYTFEDVQNKFIDIRELEKKIDDEKFIPSNCMCGHKIYKEYQIINPENGDTMILGSDCILTYMIKTMQICSKCESRYKFKPNSKNRCKKCQKVKVKCKRCCKIKKVRRSKKKEFINCKKCKKELEEEKNKCKKCNKKINGDKYTYCYNCNIEKKKFNY